MKLAKRIHQTELRTAVELLDRGRKALLRQEWEKGETQEAWDRAVATFFAVLKAQLDYEQEADNAPHGPKHR